MSSQGGHTDRQSRQSILQELQQQKQQLLQQAPPPPPPPGSPSVPPPPMRPIARPSSSTQDAARAHTEPVHSTAATHSRRSDLEQAKEYAKDYARSHSNGYFVVVDSQFGNNILPGVPRLDDS